MHIGLLHLSDIHLRTGAVNPVLDWTEAIASAVAAEASECEAIHLLLSGDVVYSGKPEEYAIAGELLASLTAALHRYNIKVESVVAVPGNHDCDFTLSQGVRDALLDKAVCSPDSSVVKACVAVQAPFRAFAESQNIFHPAETSLVGVHDIDLGGTCLRVLAFNSAWMSSIREQGGTLRAPIDYMVGDCEDAEHADAEIVVWMMHHPYNWFEPEAARHLRREIESCADVVVTGHEHDGGSYTRAYRTGPQVDYVEGGLLQEGAEGTASSFNLVVIDTTDRRQRTILFQMENDLYVSTGVEAWYRFVRNRARLTRLFEHSLDFRDQLDDVGAPFTHPRLSALRLGDVFVYPDLRDLPVTGAKDRNLIRDLPEYVRSRRRVVLVGPEKSGKSSIARRLVADLHGSELVTILADGETFSPRGSERLRRDLRRLIESQYSRDSVEPILRLPAQCRCLVIDNYNKMKLSRAGRAEFLRHVDSYFDIVVLLASEDFRFEYMAQEPESADSHPIFDYSHAEIMQLGHVKRHELISRWYWAGRDRAETDEAVVQREILHAETLLSGLIGRNLIPSFPVFVLIMLQQLETGRPHDTGAGSQGYLYQSLILDSLSRIARDPHEIDSRFNYLTELAWHCSVVQQRARIDAEELRRWHNQYCERQLVGLAYPKYIDDLVRVGILRRENGAVAFSYPYIKYFFVARYLKAHLHEDGARGFVREAVHHLHDEKTAMVLVFLAHLSSDPFVLDTMLEAAVGLFAEFGEWDTSSQTGYLNALVQQTPQLAALTASLEDNRLAELERFDEGEAAVESLDHEEPLVWQEDDRDFDQEMAPILKLNSAMKTIQIIGQILRNYPGSLDGVRKVELAENCYRLGLRLLRFIYASIEDHGEEFIRGIVTHVVRMRPEARADQITTEANAFLFALCERCSFGVVRHISQSLGHQDLAPVFKEIERRGEGRTPFRVIDLSIKLDHYRDPPADEAIQLHADERGNTIVTTLVRHLVWYHLYLFPTDYRTRQRLCEKLEIGGQSRLIQSQQKLVTRNRPRG